MVWFIVWNEDLINSPGDFSRRVSLDVIRLGALEKPERERIAKTLTFTRCDRAENRGE